MLVVRLAAVSYSAIGVSPALGPSTIATASRGRPAPGERERRQRPPGEER
jgi:hypothetical protein